jgi:hypothetical protein
MSISVKMGKLKKLQKIDEVQNFGAQWVDTFDSKQFVSLHGPRVNVMLRDITARSYEGKAGAELLLSHIESEESDRTYWASSAPVTEPTGERQQKKKQFSPVDLASLAPKDLTEADFNRLPAEGTIDSKMVYFSQLRCSPQFQGVLDLGDGITCKTVLELTDALKKKPALADRVYRIKIVWYESKVTTVDNRRLKAHREAGVPVRYQKKTWIQLTDQERGHFDEQAPASNINVT